MTVSRPAFFKTIAAAATLLTISTAIVNAQAMKDVTATDTITLPMDSPARTLEFDTGVADIKIPQEGIVNVVPETDRIFSFTPVKSGSVTVSAYAPDGNLVRRFNVNVPGHVVKIYGQRTVDDGPAPDYRSYVCTDIGCGRADADMPQPGSSSVAVTHKRPNGDYVTRTRDYH